MPERKRKQPAVLNPKKNHNHQAIPEQVARIASEIGLALEGLLDWKVYPNGKVVLIAPNGMKFVVEARPTETTPGTTPPIKGSIKGKSKPKALEVNNE